ncbi:hypothetical protein H4R18_005318 [Coemansia javaensis]|uniref:Carbohydrate-binding module family 96 domain-containing protein n=1 Tax=Coemansia javaensis TaxID=2761396 RepID=A0A9W8H6C8_9FUNG|nr:hypothetical protein H4R18_005318 [Coemansia javaensis]
MKLLAVLAATALAAAALPQEVATLNAAIPAAKDATIVISSSSCPACPESNCNKCTWGTNSTLATSTSATTVMRALIGFTLDFDGSLVKTCTLQIPGFDPKTTVDGTINVNQAENKDWDEATVDGENAPAVWGQAASVAVPAYSNLPAVDISQICRSSQNRQFSVYLTSPGTQYTIPSKDSGNPAILQVVRYLKAQ